MIIFILLILNQDIMQTMTDFVYLFVGSKVYLVSAPYSS